MYEIDANMIQATASLHSRSENEAAVFTSHLQLLVNVQNTEEVVAMYRIRKKSLLCTDVISMVGSESAN